MVLPNAKWQEIIAQASTNVEVLKATETMKTVQHILQCNMSVCQSLGQSFLSQLTVIYVDMLKVYRCVTEILAFLAVGYLQFLHSSKFQSPVAKAASRTLAEVLALLHTNWPTLGVSRDASSAGTTAIGCYV